MNIAPKSDFLPDTEIVRGPQDGDYVRYLEHIEDAQLARLNVPHELVKQARPVAPTQKPQANRTLSRLAQDREAMRARFEDAQKKIGRWGLAQVLSAIIGAALLLLTFAGLGNAATFLIGLILLWGPLTRLQRIIKEVSPANQSTTFNPTAVVNFITKRDKNS